jgi:hypothetical protein
MHHLGDKLSLKGGGGIVTTLTLPEAIKVKGRTDKHRELREAQ